MRGLFLETVVILAMVVCHVAFAETVQLQVIYSFTNQDYPAFGLSVGPDGNLYGTTPNGGDYDYGTIFRVATNGQTTTVKSFDNTNGGLPYTSLTLGVDGGLYGTTSTGGSNAVGTVFRVTTNGGFTTVASFGGIGGAHPNAGLTLHPDGNFYGITQGTVYRMTTNGSMSLVATFNGDNGSLPSADLALGADGSLWGTTSEAGFGGAGTVFRVTTNGALSTKVFFNNRNGSLPQAKLALGADGNFYGTTTGGGSGFAGTVFRVTTNGVFTSMVSFYFNDGNSLNYEDGNTPKGGMILGLDGFLYGTTSSGGSFDGGTVFRMSANGSLTTLFSFAGTNGSGSTANLVLGPDGFFYGTTARGGDDDSGTIFRFAIPATLLTSASNQTVIPGANATFSVSAAGSSALFYQWLFNGSILTNATNSLLTVANADFSKVGGYQVVVTNSFGSVTSSLVSLIIILPPEVMNPGFDINGAFTFHALSTTNVSSTVYSSSSMNPPVQWQPVYTNVNGGTWLYVDTNTSAFSRKFYRVSTP